MELKEFISQSIKDIFDGVIEAQEYAKQKNGKVNVYQHDSIRKINFDIAVTTSKTSEISGEVDVGVGIKKIIVAGIDIEGKKEKYNSSISRINFVIPVELPNKERVIKNY